MKARIEDDDGERQDVAGICVSVQPNESISQNFRRVWEKKKISLGNPSEEENK